LQLNKYYYYYYYYLRYINNEHIIQLITGQRKPGSIQSYLDVLTSVFYCDLMLVAAIHIKNMATKPIKLIGYFSKYTLKYLD